MHVSLLLVEGEPWPLLVRGVNGQLPKLQPPDGM